MAALLRLLSQALARVGCLRPQCLRSHRDPAVALEAEVAEVDAAAARKGAVAAGKGAVAAVGSSQRIDSDAVKVAEHSQIAANVVFLAASPLVLRDLAQSPPEAEGKDALPVMALSTAHERQIIESVVEQLRCDVAFQCRHLTARTLAETLATPRPQIIHISGHGAVLPGGTYAFALEGESGSTDLFTMDRLRKQLAVMRVHGVMPQLVFLAVCHSETAARLFTEVGCPHVVACRASERVLDLSAQCFTRFFYTALMEGLTVRQAFEVARINVDVAIDSARLQARSSAEAGRRCATDETAASGIAQAQQGMPESAKFLLLPEGANHDVALVPPRHDKAPVCAEVSGGGLSSPAIPPAVGKGGEAVACPRPQLQRASSHSSLPRAAFHVPPQTEHMVGRQGEIQKTIALLQKHRVVCVHGPRLLGKTTVAKAVCHYLAERAAFPDGVFFLECSERLHTRDEVAAALGEMLRLPSAQFVARKGADRLQRVLDAMAEFNCLLVLDGASSAFSYYLVIDVLNRTQCNVRVLVTSTMIFKLPAEHGFTCGVVVVRELPVDACLQLIYAIAPWMLSGDANAMREKREEALRLIASCGQSPFHLRNTLAQVAYAGGR
jgi:hypothetical protein